MMKKSIFLLCCFFGAGCTFETINEPTVAGGKKIRLSQPSGNPYLTHINSVRVGMTSDEVAATMGEKTTIGYERPDPASSAYHPVTVNNPYYKEFLRSGDKAYDVFYYFSHVQRADGIIASDELTPLVFEKDVLIGQGWDFLNKLKNQETAK